jgi:hypothetical protein
MAWTGAVIFEATRILTKIPAIGTKIAIRRNRSTMISMILLGSAGIAPM